MGLANLWFARTCRQLENLFDSTLPVVVGDGPIGNAQAIYLKMDGVDLRICYSAGSTDGFELIQVSSRSSGLVLTLWFDRGRLTDIEAGDYSKKSTQDRYVLQCVRDLRDTNPEKVRALLERCRVAGGSDPRFLPTMRAYIPEYKDA